MQQPNHSLTALMPGAHKVGFLLTRLHSLEGALNSGTLVPSAGVNVNIVRPGLSLQVSDFRALAATSFTSFQARQWNVVTESFKGTCAAMDSVIGGGKVGTEANIFWKKQRAAFSGRFLRRRPLAGQERPPDSILEMGL
ncbi:UNVERIFIED_CONTAM: hypothetical protein K2H54_065117 [Gekko kuhli]